MFDSVWLTQICSRFQCVARKICFPLRQVHISQATLDCLDGIYETEQGHGQDRSEFLRKHNIDTYLIRPAAWEEAQPPKARRPSYDEMTTWSAELPFGDILGMNFVSATGLLELFGYFVLSYLFFPIDLGHFYQRFFYSATKSHCSSAFGFPGSQQKNSSGNGSSKQRTNEEGAHHYLHSSVQGLPNGGKGNFLLRAELDFRCSRQVGYLFCCCCFFSTLRSEMNSSRPTWFVLSFCSSY